MKKEKVKIQPQPKAPAKVKVGFFKRKILEYKAKRLLKWSIQFGLTLVKIERRNGVSYIVDKDGGYLRIGSGR